MTHAGRPLLVRYDLDAVRNVVDRFSLASRHQSLWRYHELLPLAAFEDRTTLGEAFSPLVEAPQLGRALGLPRLRVKDESTLPTGSFKSRGMAVAISMAREAGVSRAAIPTAGNAGSAFASYAAVAGIEAFVFMPADAPARNQQDVVDAGGRLVLVEGLISDCGRIVAEGEQRVGWFNMATLVEPYRLEGKKTMGLELVDQLGWSLPDAIVYPTGGGTGLIGMWKAFDEMEQLGWILRGRRPRMVAVQSDGCCPIVRAFEAGAGECAPFPDAQTMAAGLRVPYTTGDFLVLDALRESGGTAVAVEEQNIPMWMDVGLDTTGISFGPESATCIGAAIQLRQQGWLSADEQVVLFNCGSDRSGGAPIDVGTPTMCPGEPVDWSMFSE